MKRALALLPLVALAALAALFLLFSLKRDPNVKPDVLVSGDMSCMMHLGGLAKEEGKPIKTLHLAQVLRDALKNGKLI